MSTFTVTGEVLDPAGNPTLARVEAVLSQEVYDPATDKVYFGATSVKTDPDTGEFTLELLDGDGMVPEVFGYTLTVTPIYKRSGVNFQRVSFEAPGTGGALDLHDLLEQPHVFVPSAAITTATADSFVAGRVSDPDSLTRAAIEDLGGGGGGGATTLDGLTDVTITSPVTGALLQWNGSAWVDGSAPAADADDLTDVEVTSPVTGALLRFNGSLWVDVDPAAYLLELLPAGFFPCAITYAEDGDYIDPDSAGIDRDVWKIIFCGPPDPYTGGVANPGDPWLKGDAEIGL